jgi:hypothetical protein
MTTLSKPMIMSDRQRKFRELYVGGISPFYNGIFHIGVMYGVGSLVVFYCLTQLDNPSWAWLTIIPVAIAGNFVEWAMHKFVMHRLIDVFALRAIYDRHTRQHHQYFTDTDYTIGTVKEHRIVFFPLRVLIVLGIFGLLISYCVAKAINANVGYIVYMTMVSHYLIYETFHYCCHIQENWFVRNVPLVNTIRRHHAAHHNLGIMMHKNMNLTFPLADRIMGTSDLKRGLLGTLFNGFNENHINPDLLPIISKFKEEKVQKNKVTLEGPILTNEEKEILG